MNHIFTKRECLKALKAAGFQKSHMQLTRVATTYSLNGEWKGPVVSVTETTVMVQDLKGPYSFSPNLMGIANMAAGAAAQAFKVTGDLITAGALPHVEGWEAKAAYTPFDVAAAIAHAYATSQTVASVDLAVTDFEVGEPVKVHAFGHWYGGKVAKLGRSKVHVTFTTGSGCTRTRPIAPGGVRKAVAA